MTIKTKRIKSLFALITAVIMVCITVLACKSKPTATDDFQIYDSNDKSDNGDNNGFVNDPKYDTKLIDYRKVEGANPVVVAYGDNGQNLMLIYDRNGEIYYKSSINAGLKITVEGTLGKHDGIQLESPVIFARESRITVIASLKGTFGGSYNFPVQPTVSSKIMQIQGSINQSTGVITWDSEWQNFGVNGSSLDIGTYTKGKIGGFYNQYAVFSGVGKGKAGEMFVLPIAVASLQQYTSEFGVVVAYSSDGRNWALGNVFRHGDNDRMAVTTYLQTKVFKVNGNSVDLLARPRWNGSAARNLGKITLNNYNNAVKNSGYTSTVGVLDAQSVFETAISSENGQAYTYIINGRGNNSNIKLAKFKGETLNGTPQREITISSSGRAGSVAIIGDGSIATFTDEGGQLVYRRFTQKYFENQTQAGNEVAQ